jgi:MFS family permease
LQTGLAFLPMTLVVAALSLGITARLMARFGALRLLSVGMVLPIVGLLLLTTAGPGTSYFPTVFIAYVCVGLGMGTSFMPLLTIAMADVPMADAGLASGIINVSMQMAAALGLAVLGTIAANHTSALLHAGASSSSALTGGFHLAFEIAAVLVAIGIVIAQTVLRTAGGAGVATQGVAGDAPAQRSAPEGAPEPQPVGGRDVGADSTDDADAHGDVEWAPQPA